jgi:hypothetical protein
LIDQLEHHFPEAQVTGYEKLIGVMTNDPKDRHVAAAAVHSSAQVIVTSNLRDFPEASLRKWRIEARHPDEFLVDLLGHHPAAIVSKLRDQAATIGRTIPQLLQTLQIGVPRFAGIIGARLALNIAAV